MLSASSVFRRSVVSGVVAFGLIEACAYAPPGADVSSDAGCITGCDGQDSGGQGGGEDAFSGGGSSGGGSSGGGSSGGGSSGGGSHDAGGGGADAQGVADAGLANDSGVAQPPIDSGDWVNMTGNPTGCDNLPGTPCGYSATNNGVGYVCGCREGTWADGWTCDMPTACVVPGSQCPNPPTGATTCDAGVASDAGAIDSGSVVTDAGNWIDMTTATACDNHPGTPCGWSATNSGSGYTCVCFNGLYADGWGCEPPGTATYDGGSCP